MKLKVGDYVHEIGFKIALRSLVTYKILNIKDNGKIIGYDFL